MNRRKLSSLVLPLFLAVLLAGVLFWLRTVPSAPVASGEAAVADEGRQVILYFATPDGRQLAGEARRVTPCNDETSCRLATVRALLDGPTPPLLPLFARGGVVGGVTLNDGLAVVDLGGESLNGHPGGSLAEWLSLMGLVNTLTANFPAIRQVSVLVNGVPRESWRGHVDLRSPVVADYSLLQTTGGRVTPPVVGR